jgi:hypothetical protein
VTNALAYYFTVKKVRALAIIGTLLKAEKLKTIQVSICSKGLKEGAYPSGTLRSSTTSLGS